MGVDVHGEVRPGLLRRGDEGGHHLVVIGAAGVLGADGHLRLLTRQPVAHAAHVHADGLGDAGGHGGGAAVPHLLKDGDVMPHPAVQGGLALGQTFGLRQQDGHGQLVVQKTALDIAGGGDGGAGVEADQIAGHDAQRAGLLGGGDVLVDDHLHGVPRAGGGGVIAVDVDGGVLELEGTGVGLALPGDDADVFRLAVVGLHPAEGGEPQAAGSGDLCHHAAQRVQMGHEQQAVVLRRVRVQADQHAALAGEPGVKAQPPVLAADVLGGVLRVAGGAVNGHDGLELLQQVFHIQIHNESLLIS